MASVAAPRLAAPVRFLPDAYPALIWLALAWIVAHAPILEKLAGSWFDARSDMQHGVAVPLIVAYLVWSDREVLSRYVLQPQRWGIAVAGLGVLQTSVASLGDWTYLIRMGMIVTGIGALIALCGPRILRKLAFPLLLLLFAVPPPTFVYEQVTLQLQLIASTIAELFLETAGYSVLREGNILELGGSRWSVAEACSGIRSLVTLTFFFLLYTYLFVTRPTIKVVLIAALIPIAVLGNSLRIIVTVIVGRYDAQLATGVMHDAAGYVVVAVCAAACIALHRTIERFSPREISPA